MTAAVATAPTVTTQSARTTIAAFVAGLALAGSVALGLNLASPSHASSKPVPSAPEVRVSGPTSADGCPVYRGPC